MPDQTIASFRGEYQYLSNFYRCSIMYEGMEYVSAENAFQAAKTLNMKERVPFQFCAPGQAKHLGKNLALREDWEQVKEQVMEEVLMIKFSIPDLREKLLSTVGTYLVEGNDWHDCYWGKCTCPTHNGQGQNALGKILMKVREAASSETK
jgi:hypothetical protein